MSNWILIENTHINLDKVVWFSWEHDEDAGCGYLTMKDASGDVTSFEDPDKALYKKVCDATCQNTADIAYAKTAPVQTDTHNCGYCGRKTPGSDPDVLCSGCREVFGHGLFSEL